MGKESKIEWTDATWNPVTGCTKISQGCKNCYAETFAERWRGIPGHPFENGFDITLKPHKLNDPIKWKTPKRIFVNSMSDLFHEKIPFDYIDRVWKVMTQDANWHTYQVLTKRPERMEEYCKQANITQNIWLGVSVEDKNSMSRIDVLKKIEGGIKFLSIEPLLGPLPNLNLDGIDWVIVGGESGSGARPMSDDWVIEIMRSCKEFNVPFLFKQWGEWIPFSQITIGHWVGNTDNKLMLESEGRTFLKLGKKNTGRLINGIEYNGYPG